MLAIRELSRMNGKESLLLWNKPQIIIVEVICVLMGLCPLFRSPCLIGQRELLSSKIMNVSPGITGITLLVIVPSSRQCFDEL